MKLIYAWDDPYIGGGGKYSKIPDNVRAVMQEVDRVKVGKRVFTRLGPAAVAMMHERGRCVFLDLKYHDIPNTVSDAVKEAMDLGVSMLNVHASGGRAMMEAAALARDDHGGATKVIAVTLLTSINHKMLSEVGMPVRVDEDGEPMDSEISTIAFMAEAAAACGLDGVVCSAQEAAGVRRAQAGIGDPFWAEQGEDFLIVCPAIRPAWSVPNDQKRPTTPRQAQDAGASEIVLGRAVSDPPGMSPAVALDRIREELA